MVLNPARVLLALVVLGLAGLLAWSELPRGSAARKDRAVLGIVSVGRVRSLHPHDTMIGVTSLMRTRLMQALWEGLVELDPGTQLPRAALAEHWELSADRTVATFHLRPDAKWSNGDAVVANDFIFALQQAIRERSNACDALLILKNARALCDGSLADLDQLGARALDDRTLRLELEHPVPGLLVELCDTAWLPLHRGSYGVLRSRAYLAEPSLLVTNGAFRLAAVSSDMLTLRPNALYYARDQIRLSGIEVHYTESAALYGPLLESGRGQLSDRLPTGEVQAPADPAVELWCDPTLVGGYIHFNVRRGPLADVRVRRALSLALDRAELARSISEADVRPAYTCLPPVADWDKERTVGENLAEARRLLAEAGYPAGRGFPVLTWPYRFSELDATMRLPEACAEQWRARLGIPLYLVPSDAAGFARRVSAADYDLMLAPWFGALPDLARLASQLVEPDMRRYSGWDGGRVVDLVQAARQETGAVLHARVREVEQAFLAEMPATPVIFYNRHTLKNNSVAGWYPDPMGLHPLKYLNLDGGRARSSP